MNQNILTTFSLVSIKYFEEKQQFYLSNKSFIRDEVFLTSTMSAKDFENSLFYVETDSTGNQFKASIQFGQKVVFRHKISNKYLSHSDEFEQEQNDTTYKLKLSHHKHEFKIIPCFQYQTKISSKIRFNEDVHLVTEISGAKAGYLSTRKTKFSDIRNTILGINQHNSLDKSKFSFHSYQQREKGEECYTFGSIIWLSHIQASTFLSSKTVRNKKQVIFEHIQFQKDLQSINGLWLLQSVKFNVGGKLQFEDKFRLKNLATGSYMSFSGNYKMNENERIYSIILEEVPTQKSQFVFRSLKNQDSIIKKNSYLILRHYQSKLFIGCRKNNFFHDSEILRPISYSEFSDEDLYKIIQLGDNEDEALRFVLSIRQQLEEIQAQMNKQLTIQKLQEQREIFINIKKELDKLKSFEKLFQKVQGETGLYIPIICELLSKYRSKLRIDGGFFDIIVKILRLIYQILVIICIQNRKNQQQSFNYISYYVEDIFLGLGAENILIETFRGNYKILTKASKQVASLKNKNIITITLQMVERFSSDKNNEYWSKILKLIEFLFVLIYDGQSSIDINQRIISQQFFGSYFFTKIFFSVKIINHRIKIEQEVGSFVEIERLKNPILLSVVEEVFKLLSLLCYHRNFIAKQSINNFLSMGSSNNIEVMIAYLDMPISGKLCNSLYSLITNLYIDSSPRINREKPLSVVNFALTPVSRSMQEENQMSDRLKHTLLNKLQQSYNSRPLQISNLLLLSTKLSLEPTLSYEELALYKQQLNEKVRREGCTPELLRSIKIMIRLESYTAAEIIEIYKILREKLKEPGLNPNIVIGIMKILIEISRFTREVELKKMTAFLKYKYRIKETYIDYNKQYQYLLPFEKKIMPSVNFPSDINESIAVYNREIDTLVELWPGDDLKRQLLSLLLSQSSQNNLDYLEQIWNCLYSQVFHKKLFFQLIMNSIVITSEQLPTFDTLFDLYKKMKHLTSISEFWLGGTGENKQNLKHYIKYLIEVTNYLHQNYQGSGNQQNSKQIKQTKLLNDYTRSIVRQGEIYVNRQLLLRNLGFHKLILEILESNYFMLQNEEGEQNKKNGDYCRAQQVFSLCFQFIYGFIYNCQETKEIIHKAWNILDKFQNLPEVGQTRVYRELYKNKIQYIRQIKKSFIERILNKILRNPKPKSNQGCQFNPQYLKYLESIVKINGKCDKSNLEKLYRIIERDAIFKKILYGTEYEDGKVQLCLDMFQIKTDCIQIPFVYHIKIIGLICDMVESLDSQSTILKTKLRSTFSLSYLFRVLAGNDIYTHSGLQGEMRFLLKKQIMRVVSFIIEKHDSVNMIHDNEDLLNLLSFYYKVFVDRIKKGKDESLNEALYVPYFSQYKQQIQFYENNQRKYYKQQIVPFLQKLSSILVKAKKTDKNKVYFRIKQIMEDADDQKMVQFFEYRKMGNNIDKISLRWLNFVDRDQNNSPQQKFAKLSIVDLLRNKITKKVIVDEKQQFYKLINNQTAQYVGVLIRLLSMNMEQEYKQNQSQSKYTKIYNMLIVLRKTLSSLQTKQKKFEQISFLLEKGIIQSFVDFSIKLEFDFSKTIVRKTFNQIIKIFLFILDNSEDTKSYKQIYRCLNENPLCYRFWSHLSESILTISTDVHIENPLNQVNWCLSNIYLNCEDRNENIFEASINFLQKLCEYPPFTKFLRYQPSYPSKDFIQILYHALNFVLVKQNKKLRVTVSTVQASQKIINCIAAFMIGGNQTNQNYIVDSKFPQIIIESLKIQNIRNEINKTNEVERQRIIDEVIEFYQRNGIDLSGDLRHKIASLDFNHSYILNRLKYFLLKTLMQCVAGNQRSMSKLKFQVPIQLLKINLIWVYQDFKNSKLPYTEELVIKYLHSWKEIIDVKDLNGLFLMLGFFLYHLIENYGHEDEEKNQEQENAIEDKQKKKQKLVTKFFRTIAEKDKTKEKLQKLQNQPLGEQMKKFYQSYYEALGFFRSKTLSIQVNFNNILTKVYFPKIPICEKMDDMIIADFKQDAVRISQQQKIKSLLEFQEQIYDVFDGEQRFYKKFENIPLISQWFKNITDEKLKFVALISCFIQTIFFLVENYLYPSFNFSDHILLNPSSIIESSMFVIGIFNLLIGADMLFYLIFKKMPVIWSISREKERHRDQNERNKSLNGEKMFMAKQVLPQFISTFMYIIFLGLSFIHPFFGSFILFDIMNRLELGKQLLRSVKQTWLQLLMTTILLILFNYLFALFIYIQFASSYAPACQHLFQCLLMLVDQSLKSGSGFYGSTDANFVGLVFDLSFFSQMIYIIFAQKVMLQIFSGTIIDKFSQLRQEAEAVEQDEKTQCYICGQERFTIDFDLQGFQQHVKETHNAINYIFYLFYLRKQYPQHYSIVDKFVSDCQAKRKKHWIPNQTSILKQLKQKEKEKGNEEVDEQEKMVEYIDKKVKDLKQVRTKNANIIAQLRMASSKHAL